MVHFFSFSWAYWNCKKAILMRINMVLIPDLTRRETETNHIYSSFYHYKYFSLFRQNFLNNSRSQAISVSQIHVELKFAGHGRSVIRRPLFLNCSIESKWARVLFTPVNGQGRNFHFRVWFEHFKIVNCFRPSSPGIWRTDILWFLYLRKACFLRSMII